MADELRRRRDGSLRRTTTVRRDHRRREGSLVLEPIGDLDRTEATWTARVVEALGKGGWPGMHGEGRFRAPHGPKATLTLDCSFA
jgi:hypothetical protein